MVFLAEVRVLWVVLLNGRTEVATRDILQENVFLEISITVPVSLLRDSGKGVFL